MPRSDGLRVASLEKSLADEQEANSALGATSFHAPHSYANGFELNMSLSDVGVLLMTDGRVIGKLALSFTTAKSLAVALTDAMEQFETITSHDVMTMSDVGEAYQAAGAKADEISE